MGEAAIPQEGTTSNRYTVLGRLAGGGMADIYLTRATSETGVERHVVLKRVLASRSRDPHFAKMFLDEARLAAQLDHPNIAQVHDIGKLAGSYFFTMEYVHGEDVRRLIQRLAALRRSMPIPLALHIAGGTLAALHHAHERTNAAGQPLSIVHRDVSPSNIMVSYDGAVKLLDFGVAKASERTHESHAGTVKGKIAYLSPEQCEGAPVDRRSDVFSLGIVLYELLTARRLFRRDTDFATMMAIAREDSPPPSQVRPELSPDLDRIVLTAIARRPEDRFATAADMIDAVETVATREYHALSSTAMGRFLRELFGERPEPWHELAAQDEPTGHLTITSEVFALDDKLANALSLDRGGLDVAAVANLEAQLDAAPALAIRSDDPIGPTPSSRVMPLAHRDSGRVEAISHPGSGRVEAISHPGSGRVEAISHSGSGRVEAISHPGSARVASLRTSSPDFAPSRTSSPQLVSARASSPNLALARASSPNLGDSTFAVPTKLASPPHADRGGDTVRFWRRLIIALVALVLTTAIIVLVMKPQRAPSASLPAVSVMVIPTVDAAVAQAVATDAPSAESVVPTIEDLAAAARWSEALELCTATHGLDAADRLRCGIAACSARQRRLAVIYRSSAARGDRPAIERACRDHGIPFVTQPARPLGEDCELNPLKCRE